VEASYNTSTFLRIVEGDEKGVRCLREQVGCHGNGVHKYEDTVLQAGGSKAEDRLCTEILLTVELTTGEVVSCAATR
jgi:hypothetical protein